MNSTTSRLKEGFVLRCPVEDDLLPKSQIMGSEDHTVFIKVCFHFYLYCMVFYSTIWFLTKSWFQKDLFVLLFCCKNSLQISFQGLSCITLPHGQTHYRLITNPGSFQNSIRFSYFGDHFHRNNVPKRLCLFNFTEKDTSRCNIFRLGIETTCLFLF